MERTRLSADLRMRRHAAEFVRDVTARSQLPLDYSVASLRVVDFIVDGLRKSGRDRTAVGHVLFGLGVYAGEVLVRRAGAVWVEFDEGQRELFGRPVGVRMPDGRVWNPLGKVVKRFEVGERESLRTFYLQLHGRARPGLPALPGLPAQPRSAEAGGAGGTGRTSGAGGTGGRASRGTGPGAGKGTGSVEAGGTRGTGGTGRAGRTGDRAGRGTGRGTGNGIGRGTGPGSGREAVGPSDGL
ncbi:hypothetical protein [Streptomyces phaeochromogenes]|uniref:hypothetical protein n=1 Tax=Streptomyces phaeochromogenes TaxID=1923 RepID=UPI002DDAA86B|nr:hypothetical protein [Streptomyces phaeochromogenes]